MKAASNLDYRKWSVFGSSLRLTCLISECASKYEMKGFVCVNDTELTFSFGDLWIPY